MLRRVVIVLLKYYALGAVATALTAWVVLYLPIISDLKKEGYKTHLLIGSLVYLIYNVIIAPILLTILLDSKAIDVYKNTFKEDYRSRGKN